MRALSEQAKVYWEKKEAEYGEKIHTRCMCKYESPSAEDQEIEWGILFFGDYHLYFQGFPAQKSWKKVLFRNTDSGEEKGSFIRLPLKELTFKLEAQQIRWWQKIWSNPERSLFANHSLSHYKTVQYHFILFQPDAEKIAEVIQDDKVSWID